MDDKDAAPAAPPGDSKPDAAAAAADAADAAAAVTDAKPDAAPARDATPDVDAADSASPAPVPVPAPGSDSAAPSPTGAADSPAETAPAANGDGAVELGSPPEPAQAAKPATLAEPAEINVKDEANADGKERQRPGALQLEQVQAPPRGSIEVSTPAQMGATPSTLQRSVHPLPTSR